MSKGPGKIERALIVAFENEPHRRFTIDELVEIAYDLPRPPRQKFGG